MVLKHVKLPNNSVVDINDARNVVIGDGVNNAVSLTTAQYEALTTKDPNTIYVITDAQEGAGSVVVWGTETSSHTIPLTVNGVTKTVALNGYDSGGGGGGTDNVFIATYGTTTYSKISEAYTAGKAIFTYYNDDLYVYSGISTMSHSFFCIPSSATTVRAQYVLCSSSNVWSNGSQFIVSDADAVHSITGETMADTWPTTNAVYNFVGSLNTTNTTAQTTSASEKLTGTINLHKVAKTGSFNDLLNKPDSLPAVASGDAGKFLAVTGTGGTYQWNKVDYIHGVSTGVELAYDTSLYAVGSLGETMIYSGGINHGSFTDWSWITRGNLNNAVTLQDTLDAIGLPSVGANDFGSMLYVAYDSAKGYYWEKTTGSYGPYFTSAQLSCGFNCSFAVYGSFGATSITTEGISKSDYSDWSWIKTTYNNGNTNITKTLQSDLDLKAPLASPALTGTPTAPTASSGTNTTQIATTAFVQTAVSTKQNAITVSSSEPTSSQGSNGDIWIVI